MTWSKSYQFLCEYCTFFEEGYCRLHKIKVKHDRIACKDYDD